MVLVQHSVEKYERTYAQIQKKEAARSGSRTPLVIDENWKKAIKKSLEKKRPPEGWPKPSSGK
jgi:hypothetical protein